MLHLLLVDDQPHHIENLRQIIEDSALSSFQLWSAESGYEALDILKEVSVDIMITDIRMPEISGIELIERTRQLHRHVRCILLSGYSEFEYAQQALELGTVKYLLKPVDEQELLHLLERLTKDILLENEEQRRIHTMNYAFRGQLPGIRRQFADMLLQGKYKGTSERLRERLTFLDLPLELGTPYMLVNLHIEAGDRNYSDEDMDLLRYGIFNIAEEGFRDDYHLLYGSLWRDEMAVFVWPSAQGQGYTGKSKMIARVKQLTKELQHNVSKYLNRDITAGFVEYVSPFPEQIQLLHKSARSIVGSQACKSPDRFATRADFPIEQITGPLRSLYEPPLLSHLLETRRWKPLQEKLETVFKELEEKWAESEEYGQEAFLMIAAVLQKALHQKGQGLNDSSGHGMNVLRILSSREQFKAWVAETLHRVKAAYGEESTPHNRNMVQKAVQYMDHHLHTDLSLTQISEEVGLHPSYLSKVFKDETGITVSEYITKSRMERAVHLIRTTDMKVYEVAEQVGYATAHYFIKIFIKHFGLTPQEYRISFRATNKQ